MPDPKEDRPPGRSFEDPSRPLGADILEHSEDAGPQSTDTVYGRAAVGAPHNGVAERAKAIAVLRKAEEFMRTDNPAPRDPIATRRALQLAAGRLGMHLDEYDAIVRGDPELEELERKVLADEIARVKKT